MDNLAVCQVKDSQIDIEVSNMNLVNTNTRLWSMYYINQWLNEDWNNKQTEKQVVVEKTCSLVTTWPSCYLRYLI